jgi:D-psicose/D-tagatose/L-ribulose 3-epimerase
MKIAVSNIAWPAELDDSVFAFLAAGAVEGVEVAPTRVWPQWEGIDPVSVRVFRRSVESHGLRVSSLQSILFQKPELRLFGTDAERQALDEHLRRCADLAAGLGAECMVLGAPRNRDRGALSEPCAFEIAARFFARAGTYCAERGVCLVFEANPAEYRCNFATDSVIAAKLVNAVGSEGFRLHLDTACLQLAGENTGRAIIENAGILRHFHASEPYLADFSAPVAAHEEAAAALKSVNYDRWVALEMRAAKPALPALQDAVRFVRTTYGDAT